MSPGSSGPGLSAHRPRTGGTLVAPWLPGGLAAAAGELGGRSAPICCHKSGLRAARWLPHCWGAPGALQHGPAAVPRRGGDPSLDPHTAEIRSRAAGEAWRAAGPELGLAPHAGGASGEELGNAGCPRCGAPQHWAAPSTARLFVWLQQLRPFGASGAHPSPREQKKCH